MLAYQTVNTWSQSGSLFQKLCEGTDLNRKVLWLCPFFMFLRWRQKTDQISCSLITDTKMTLKCVVFSPQLNVNITPVPETPQEPLIWCYILFHFQSMFTEQLAPPAGHKWGKVLLEDLRIEGIVKAAESLVPAPLLAALPPLHGQRARISAAALQTCWAGGLG